MSAERMNRMVVEGLTKLREDFIKKAKKADEQGLEALTGPKGGCVTGRRLSGRNTRAAPTSRDSLSRIG